MSKLEKKMEQMSSEELDARYGGFEGWYESHKDLMEAARKRYAEKQAAGEIAEGTENATASERSAVESTAESTAGEIAFTQKSGKSKRGRFVFGGCVAGGLAACLAFVAILIPVLNGRNTPATSGKPSEPVVPVVPVEPIEPVEPEEPKYVYSSKDLKTADITVAEAKTYFEEFHFVQNLQNTTCVGVQLQKDNTVVFVSLYGELETTDDYYMITMNQPLDEHYDYTDKQLYQEGEAEYSINGYVIQYHDKELTGRNMFGYWLNITDQEGRNFYWYVECFSEDIEAFFELAFQA
ncbi:MAG: hypothetical protein IJY62_06065 [Clostridia bacterium]|nr:hypothetical protein [Clostridia bacterium]